MQFPEYSICVPFEVGWEGGKPGVLPPPRCVLTVASQGRAPTPHTAGPRLPVGTSSDKVPDLEEELASGPFSPSVACHWLCDSGPGVLPRAFVFSSIRWSTVHLHCCYGDCVWYWMLGSFVHREGLFTVLLVIMESMEASARWCLSALGVDPRLASRLPSVKRTGKVFFPSSPTAVSSHHLLPQTCRLRVPYRPTFTSTPTFSPPLHSRCI